MAGRGATAGHAAGEPRPPGPLARQAWWPAAKRTLSVAFFALVVYLIAKQARLVEWDEVWASVQAYPATMLLGAAALAALSHLTYATYDLISRHQVGHTLGTGRVMLTTFISYAFNLNFGSLVGGLAFRFRLYAKQGLEPGVISQIFGFSMLTNWLGYLVLAGVLCIVQPIAPPEEWPLGSGALSLLGAALLATACAYLGLCAFSKKRTLSVRGHSLHLPSLRMALLQMAMSSLNWMLIAGTAYLLLQQQVGYASVLMVALAAAVAGVITHVPAGIGVLEAVYITMLSDQVAKSELVAALLVYRALYYLLPLAVAIVAFLLFEWRLKKQAARTAA